MPPPGRRDRAAAHGRWGRGNARRLRHGGSGCRARRRPRHRTRRGGTNSAWLRLPASDDAPGGTAIVELGATSGIELLADLRPLDAHTFGLGQAIAAALAAGVSRVVVGLGSSASTDGGTGMLRALGGRFLDAAGDDVPLGGAGLASIARVDLSGLPPLPPGGVSALTDVTNPLLGRRGAAAVFGPQKGADQAQVAQLDAALAGLARLVAADPSTPGAGAAGGTGFGLLAWGATLEPGSRAVAELIGLPEAAAAASVVITGEGSFDGQSAAGKVPSHVASLAGEGRRHWSRGGSRRMPTPPPSRPPSRSRISPARRSGRWPNPRDGCGTRGSASRASSGSGSRRERFRRAPAIPRF